MRIYGFAAVVGVAGVVAACGGSSGEGALPPTGAGGFTPGPTGAGAGPVATTPPPPVTAAPSMATPIPPAMAAVATPMMQGVAGNEAKGMQPDGVSFAANFQQGQIFEQPFTVQANKCYTVVAVGINITELDLMIVADTIPGQPPVQLAQDNTTGPQAVIGGGGACMRNPLPLGGPAKVVMRATGGAGIGVGQIFVK